MVKLIKDLKSKCVFLIVIAIFAICAYNLFYTHVESFINSEEKPVLMLFYSPSCPYCVKAMPIWDQLSSVLKKDINCSKINCEPDKQFCKRYKLKKVPSLVLSKDGNQTVYQGEITPNKVKRFLNQSNVFVNSESFQNINNSNNSNSEEILARCPQSNLYTQTAKDGGTEYCLSMPDGGFNGCQSMPADREDLSPWRAAFATVSNYLDTVSETDKNTCSSAYSQKFADWGLCNCDTLKTMKTEHNENIPIANTIEYACKLNCQNETPQNTVPPMSNSMN